MPEQEALRPLTEAPKVHLAAKKTAATGAQTTVYCARRQRFVSQDPNRRTPIKVCGVCGLDNDLEHKASLSLSLAAPCGGRVGAR